MFYEDVRKILKGAKKTDLFLLKFTRKDTGYKFKEIVMKKNLAVFDDYLDLWSANWLASQPLINLDSIEKILKKQ